MISQPRTALYSWSRYGSTLMASSKRRLTAHPGMPLIIILILLGMAPGLASTTDPVKEADALLSSPTLNLGQALYALDLYRQTLSQAHPPQAPLLIRLARTCFVVGELTVASQRRKYYEEGRNYAKMLIKEQPARVDGYYWLALNLCGLADTCGAMEGRKLLPQIMKELKRAQALDSSYDQAGCHRVLGRIYYEAPAWPFSVGDLQKSLEQLTLAVRLAPDNSTNHLYLAETLVRLQRPEQARLELEQVLKCSSHALPPQGLKEDHREAKKLLARIKGFTGTD